MPSFLCDFPLLLCMATRINDGKSNDADKTASDPVKKDEDKRERKKAYVRIPNVHLR